MEKETKKYLIKTIEDLSDVINEDNFANFMIDLTDLMIKIVKVKKEFKKLNGEYPKGLMPEYTWIDDGENGTKQIDFGDGQVLKFDTFKKQE